MTYAGPRLVHVAQVTQSKFVSMHQFHFCLKHAYKFIRRDEPAFVGLGEIKVGNFLLVQPNIPPHNDVFLRLCFLQFLIVVCFQLQNITKWVTLRATSMTSPLQAAQKHSDIDKHLRIAASLAAAPRRRPVSPNPPKSRPDCPEVLA